MKDGEHTPEMEGESHLRDSVEGLRQMAFGIVGRLAGAEHVADDVDMEKPAVSPEIDGAIERLGVALGSVLEEAGRALKKQSSEGSVGSQSSDFPEQEADSEPLFAQGADALASGLQALAKEVQSRLAKEDPAEP